MGAASDRAYEVIRRYISDGKITAGERLKEAELVSLCNVSRTPVRDALRRLASDGMVTITPNSGAVVTRWSDQELADLYQVRAQIESMAAAYAAERRTEADLVELETHATAMLALANAGGAPVDHDEVTRLNSAFHQCVLQAARSRALTAAASQVIEAPLMLRTFQRYDAERLRRSADQHMEILQAIRARDAGWAGAIMSAHIRAGFRTLVPGSENST